MNGFQTTDFSNKICEVLNLYRSGSAEVEAIIYRKPNGEFEVQGACLAVNEQKYDWRKVRHYRKLQIVTPVGNVVEFERHGTEDYRMITEGYEFSEVNSVQV